MKVKILLLLSITFMCFTNAQNVKDLVLNKNYAFKTMSKGIVIFKIEKF